MLFLYAKYNDTRKQSAKDGCWWGARFQILQKKTRLALSSNHNLKMQEKKGNRDKYYASNQTQKLCDNITSTSLTTAKE
jgi:hypothetical protein